jgi:CRP-like cAMP-binding protein
MTSIQRTHGMETTQTIRGAKERPMSESPIDRALGQLLSGAPEAALRWGAAALESDSSSPAALLVTARALSRVGRKRGAIDGYFAAARRAATVGDAPMAIAAIAELRALGVETEALLGEVAVAVCRQPAAESPWGEVPTWRGSLQPVSPLLTRRALASRATELIYEAAGTEHPHTTTTAFLGAFAPAAFRELATAFRAIVVPAGYRAIEEDAAIRDIFVVASGEVEVSRRRGRERDDARSLATLESGAMFGEMSMVARLPAASSATTTRPTILLVAPRTTLETICARHRDLRLELGVYCRRQAVGNLGAACAFVTTVPIRDRSALVDRMTTRTYARGERLVHPGEEAAGLHLILAGEVALVGRDGDDERVVLSTLNAGDVVGEAELVLCRRAETEAIAAGPTATLFLPRDEYFSLALGYPAILHGLYTAAIRRLGETGEALLAGAVGVADNEVQLDELPLALAPARVVSEGVLPCQPARGPQMVEADVAPEDVPLALAVEERPRPELDEGELAIELEPEIAVDLVAQRVPAPVPSPEAERAAELDAEPEPTVALLPAQLAEHIARARLASTPPPPLVSDVPVPTLGAPEPPGPEAEGIGAPTSSLAPVVALSAPPPTSRPATPSASRSAAAPAPRRSFARRSAQGAAIVAVAASVAVVLASREDRPSAFSLPPNGSPAMDEPTAVAAPLAAAPTLGPSDPRPPAVATSPHPPSVPSAPPPAPSTKAFLTSSLKKRPSKPAPESAGSPGADDTRPDDATRAASEAAAPAASAPPAPERPAPAPSPAPIAKSAPAATAVRAAQAPPTGDNAFGGRE